MVHILDKRGRDAFRPATMGQAATAVYLFVLLLGMPLAVHDGYFDITETKYLFFLAASVPYILLEWMLWLFGQQAELPLRRIRQLAVADIGALAFLLAYLIGALVSRGADAWIGASGRYQGFVTILAYVLVYFCVSRNFCFSRLSFIGLAAGLMLTSLLALLNDFGIDPLGIVRMLAEEQRWQFVSTLGNTNFYSAYLGTMLPVVLTAWCFAKKRLWQCLLGAALLCGFAGMLPTASESFMLALITALWLLPPFLMHEPRALRRYLAALMGMALVLALLGFLARFFPLVQYRSFSIRLLMRPAALAALLLIPGALLLLLRKRQAPLRGRRLYFTVSLALAALVVLLLILRNTVFSGISLGFIDRFLLLNESWGTDRGRIWAYCLRAFGEFGPLQKLFGGGAGCLLRFDMRHPLFPDAYLDSAHNEYLQYLLAAGVVGLGGYLALLAGTAVAALKRAQASPLTLAFMTGALAYAALALVNIAQPVSTPYLFLLLGMAAGCAVRSDDIRLSSRKASF